MTGINTYDRGLAKPIKGGAEKRQSRNDITLPNQKHCLEDTAQGMPGAERVL
jgi:hypothetical protein